MRAVEDMRDNPAELLGMLVGLELADVVTWPDAEPGAEAIGFNRATALRFVRSEDVGRIIGVASQRVGAGIGATLLDLIVLERLRAAGVFCWFAADAAALIPSMQDCFSLSFDLHSKSAIVTIQEVGTCATC